MTRITPVLAGILVCAVVSARAAGGTEPAAAAPDPAMKAARDFALAALPGQCDDQTGDNGAEPMFKDASYPLKWRYGYETTSDPEHKGTLFEIFCMAGAYNVNDVYVMKDDEGQVSLVAFAVPEYDVEYAKDDNDTYSKLKAPPRVTGMTTTYFLTNAEFDPRTQSLSSFDKWRGLGDAWDAGTWTFDEGQFVLKRFDIDPIYEANIDKPSKRLADKSFRLFPPLGKK